MPPTSVPRGVRDAQPRSRVIATALVACAIGSAGLWTSSSPAVAAATRASSGGAPPTAAHGNGKSNGNGNGKSNGNGNGAQFKCTGSLPGGGIVVKYDRHKQPKSGTLAVDIHCSRAADVTVTGTLVLTPKKRNHAKAKTTTVELGPVTATARAGKTVIVVFAVRRAALAAIKNGAAQSVTLKLTATNSSGYDDPSAQ